MPNSKNKSRIIRRLQADFETLPSKLRLVAKYIVDHAADFGLDPIRTTADKVGVSTNTLVRMAHQLGFANFEQLRDPFRNALLTTSEAIDDTTWLDTLGNAGEVGMSLAESSRNTLSIVHRSLHAQPVAQLDTIADAITHARRVYVTGYRSCYGLAHYL